MVKKKRISITADEAELCQLDVDEMIQYYFTISK